MTKQVIKNKPPPEDLSWFRTLVSRSRKVQKSSLTYRQYRRLLSFFLKSQEPIGDMSLLSFYYGAVCRLNQALKKEGVSVRSPVICTWKAPYRLKQKGFARIEELAIKIKNSIPL